MSIGRRMPGCAGGQFIAFDQYCIGPALVGQMIKRGTAANASGGYSYQQIGDYFKLHFTQIGKIVRKAREV